MAQFNIVCACDNQYLPYVLVLAQSVVEGLDTSHRSLTQDSFHFFVLCDSSIDINAFKQATASFCARHSTIQLSFEPLSIDHSQVEALNPFVRENQDANHSSYYRLLLDQVLPESVSKVLYLDVDMLVCCDIRTLFTHYLLSDEQVIAAASDLSFMPSNYALTPRNDGLEPLALDMSHYFNSGLMLLNLKAWRDKGIRQRCLELGNQYSAKLCDQDLLNAVLSQNEVEHLGLEWNVQLTACFIQLAQSNAATQVPLFALPPSITTEELNAALAAPKLLHYTFNKPWHPKPFTIVDNSQSFTLATCATHYDFFERWYECFKRTIECPAKLIPSSNAALDLLQHQIWQANAQRDSVVQSEISDLRSAIHHLKSKHRKYRKLVVGTLVAVVILQTLTFSLLIV